MLAVAFVSMFMISPVAAATSEGLEWGFAVGDRFDFTWTATDGTTTETEELYMNITAVPANPIPDPFDDWTEMPYFDIGIYWANDTDLGAAVFIFIFLAATGGVIAVPIGNFELLQEVLAPELTGETFNNDASIWGVSWATDLTTTEEMVITANYAKSDGFLAEYSISTESSVNDTVFGSFTIARDLGLDIVALLQDNIILIAVAVGVIIILVIVLKKK